jgi:glycosyltransferase involved in cell wall biosynthesis
MKMCEALSKQGNDVTLVSKASALKLEPNVLDDHGFYGVEPAFKLVRLARPATKGGEVVFSWHLASYLWSQRKHVDLVYSRNLVGAWLAVRFGLPLLFEVHDFLAGNIFTGLLHHQIYLSTHLVRMVFNSQGLQDYYRSNFGVPDNARIKVARNGADPFSLENLPSATDRTAQVLSQSESYQIGYVGQLYPGRGIDLIAKLAELIPECVFHIIGGMENTVHSWSQAISLSNVHFHGFVEPSKLPRYYKHLDLLLMPYQQRVLLEHNGTDTSQWMCPLKMFEYMATGRPIISSDLPVLREVLQHERNALLVPPDDVDAWVSAVRRLAAEPELRRKLGENARQDLLNHYTWEARARKVLHDL